MTKFLTGRSWTWLALVLYARVLLMLAGLLPYHLKRPPSPWVLQLGTGLQFAAIFALLGVGFYLGHAQPTARDLLEAAEERLGKEKRLLQAWATIEVKHLPFHEMSWKEKTLQIFFAVIGTLFCLYGVADILHLLPGEIKMPVAGGGVRAVPHWASGIAALFASFVTFSVNSVFRVKMVDREDETLRKRLEEMKPPTDSTH